MSYISPMLESYFHKVMMIFSLSIVRYIVFAGTAYFVFYVWKRRDWISMKIQAKFPDKKQLQREVFYSMLTFLIFGFVGGGVFLLSKAGYTKIYTNISDHSMWYFAFSVVAMIVLHDTYFYWTHRLMHHKKLYKYVHLVHHQSTNPTPLASFAFHPIEAVIEIGILPVVAMIMPVHPIAILLWILFMTTMNVLGHCGFEFYPSGFTKGGFTKWHNTSTHHNMHHRLVQCNYGLYFNIWDRLMQTNHKNYHEEFERTKAQSEQAEAEPTLAFH